MQYSLIAEEVAGVAPSTVWHLSTATTVEPRAIGSGRTVIFYFNIAVAPINAAAAALDGTMASAGTATAALVGGDVLVTLANVVDNKRLTITLNGLNGAGNSDGVDGFSDRRREQLGYSERYRHQRR